MHNLIKSRAVFEILRKPLPEQLQFKSDSNTESDGEDTDVDVTIKNIPNAVAILPAESTDSAVKLNANASEFVPRTTSFSVKDLNASELELQLEALDERKSIQPKLLLPWRGFPKPIRPGRPITKMLQVKEEKVQACDEQKSVARVKSKKPLSPENRKKIVKESKNIIKSPVPDEKRREQERKVALEALKLVEQRRMREQLEEEPEVIVHLTRLPVEFTPEERIRVDRLRVIKREHIEHVLREMRNEMDLKRQKDAGLQPVLSGRYISLPRVAKCQDNAEPTQLVVSEMPKRYIPTVKQWDERCKARANQAASTANKENNANDIAVAPKPVDNALPTRAMGSLSVVNVIPPIADTQPLSSKDTKDKDRELFVPRYWPPTPLTPSSETRRGNLTHARNISRAFANCGLLPLPYSIQNEKLKALSALPVEDKSVKRYAIEELLKLEPQPHELEKLRVDEAHYKFGFITE